MGLSSSFLAERFFCSAESRSKGEQIFGTVARARNWMLLEYPRIWRRHAIEDSRLLAPEIKAWLRDFDRQQTGRSLLIRQDHHSEGPLRCFRVHAGPEQPVIEQAQIREYSELPGAAFDTCEHRVLYAACTHARHDRCCAKFGLPVHCALRAAVGDRAWQCSHIGGDRFAGNVVVFPFGIYYGRVTPEDVPGIVEATERGEICLSLYRGRSCFTRNEQTAEYFARRESGNLAIDGLRPVRSAKVGDLGEVEFIDSRSVVSRVVYRVLPDAYEGRLTCHAEDASPVPQFELVSYSEGR